MGQLLDQQTLQQVFARIDAASAEFKRNFPGDGPVAQPVHTVYGGAHLYRSGTVSKISQIARSHFLQYAPDSKSLNAAVGENWEPDFAQKIYDRVSSRLETCAVEDYRIDFEDGYGYRADTEEDSSAVLAANEVAKDVASNTLSPFFGIRIKSLSEESKFRAARTLDLFLSTLLTQTNGSLPNNFVVTLPKVDFPEQPAALSTLLERFEQKYQIPSGSIKIEVMVESSQALIRADGRFALPAIIQASNGRCRGVHFGTYDYTASCDITSHQQRMNHPLCNFALDVIKNTTANSGVWISDGATATLPVPLRRGDAKTLSAAELSENIHTIHNAWRSSFANINHSLQRGIYQGWDLHPGQIPIRYVALTSFFLLGLHAATARLRNFLDKAAQATLMGDAFDDAATGQGLLNFFLRAFNCGAISEKELSASGLSLSEIRTKSFLSIVQRKSKT